MFETGMVEESFNSGDSGRRWPRRGYVSRKEQASAMGGANKSLAHGAGHYIFRRHRFSEKTRAHMPKPEIPVLRVGTANAWRFAYDKHLHTISSLGGISWPRNATGAAVLEVVSASGRYHSIVKLRARCWAELGTLSKPRHMARNHGQLPR